MFHMTHNYMLGLAVLVFCFIFFYVPMCYAFLAIRKQQKRNQNKEH
jgi:cbb3-type cytochrome oxidase subunit 3